jgi:hypothetical protein
VNVGRVLVLGFGATVVLTTISSAGRGLGLTRMDIPLMLGTMLTADRDKAKWAGFLFHVFNGWVFALVYAAAFQAAGFANVWAGMAIGLVQALFVLAAGMTVLPAIHPRMADESRGPDVTRQLEPPGFMALHYGRRTPLVTVLAHLVYGAILGMFY